jgi:hypothetical protein
MKEYGCCPKFKRGDNSTYTFTKSYLENLTTEIDSFVDITKTLDNLNNILVKSTDDAAPKTKKGQEKTKVTFSELFFCTVLLHV